MTLETFFEKFGLFAEAPNAVEKMRELVLHSAFTGKLISTEGQWQTRPLNSLTTKIGSGATPLGGRQSYRSSGIPLIRSMNVHFRGFNPAGLAFLSDEQAAQLSNVVVRPNDVLLNITGASIGRVTTAPKEMDGARVNQHVTIIRPAVEVDPCFLALFLASPTVQRLIYEIQVGATREALTKAMIERFNIPTPTLAEQKRIVAKVYELMALCDSFEAQRKELETQHAAVARASLARFADAPTPANLNLLFHKSYTISPADLRKTILTVAVRGRLVEHDSQDRSTDQLLPDMRSRRQKLVDEQKIRKPRDLPAVAEDEIPFPTDDSWRWVRWGHICDWITYGFTRPMSHVRDGPAIVTAKNVQDGFLYFEGAHRADETEFAALNPKDRPRRGDILITKDGTIGRAAIVEADQPFCINQSVAVLWLESCLLYRPFLLLVIRSPFAQGPIWDAAEGMAIKHLSITDFGRMILPIPPVSEQLRIVAKVNQLMALVDQLEKHLAATRTTAIALMDAVVAELTSQQNDVADPAQTAKTNMVWF